MRVLALSANGLNASRIAEEMALPRSTVRGWLAGVVPAHSRNRTAAALPACVSCGHEAHRFADLDHRYAYLLGLYLGDGSISSHARRVYKLRITLDTRYPGIIEFRGPGDARSA